MNDEQMKILNAFNHLNGNVELILEIKMIVREKECVGHGDLEKEDPWQDWVWIPPMLGEKSELIIDKMVNYTLCWL